jgi:hypothetical protein
MFVAYNNIPFFTVGFHVTKTRIDWCTIFLITFLALVNGYTYTTTLIYHITFLTTTTWFKTFNIYTALWILYIVTCYITSWFCYQYQRFLTICSYVERTRGVNCRFLHWLLITMGVRVMVVNATFKQYFSYIVPAYTNTNAFMTGICIHE